MTPPEELLLQGAVYTPPLRISVAAAAPWPMVSVAGIGTAELLTSVAAETSFRDFSLRLVLPHGNTPQPL